MLPIDLVLVRHGQSEGNVAIKASEHGDNSFFTPEFRGKHSRMFHLTDKGIEQAKMAGEWIKKNVAQPFDRFYVSDYIRAKETAAHLRLENALWRSEFHLRERDKGLMDNMSIEDQRNLFVREEEQYRIDPFLCYPAGGGESIANLCLRLKTSMLEHWARECSNKRVICVSHGHVMRALQLEAEAMGHDDFIRLDSSEDPKDKIRNCQILWYTRRDPDKDITEKPSDHLVAVRSVSPSEPNADWGWRRIERKKFTNEELLAEVARYPRHVNSE